MELGRPGRSVQKACQPLQARLSDRRQPDWQCNGSGNSTGFHTATTVAPQRTVFRENVAGSWRRHGYELGMLLVATHVRGDVLESGRLGVDGRRGVRVGVCGASGGLNQIERAKTKIDPALQVVRSMAQQFDSLPECIFHKPRDNLLVLCYHLLIQVS